MPAPYRIVPPVREQQPFARATSYVSLARPLS
jgi:hypothetical protein